MQSPTGTELQGNGGVFFYDQNGTQLWARSNVGSWEPTSQKPYCIDVYSIGFKKYWKGTVEYDLTLLLNDIRII